MKNSVGGKKPTEARVTKALSRWFFNGGGRKYLGRIGDKLGYDPRSHLIRITRPTDRRQFARWNPAWEHLCHDEKGVTFDDATKYVPFVSVDLDRHDGSIGADAHKQVVVDAGRHVREAAPGLKWMVEVNPANGSSKFFGFLRSGRLLHAPTAQRIARELHAGLVRKGLCHGSNVEVFPHNCKAVKLPLHPGKITVVDQGMLRRATRRVRDVRYFPEKVYEPMRTYSTLWFAAWMVAGENYDEETLDRALEHAVAGLPDDEEAVGISGALPEVEHEAVRAAAEGRRADWRTANQVTPPPGVLQSQGEARQENPNAFERNWEALLPFARNFYRRRRRLPTLSEALTHLRENRLFSGRWGENEARRKRRVADILKKIEETFDPAMLSGGRGIQRVAGIDRWCHRRFPIGVNTRLRVINEFEMSARQRQVHVPAKFVAHLVQIIVFCLRDDPTENEALPTNRIKVLWDRLPDAPSWNQTYFQVVRDLLDRLGVIDIYDRCHVPGKAWRWRRGENFPGRKRMASAKMVRYGASKDWRVREEERRVHNSLYQTVTTFNESAPRRAFSESLSRPPPV